MTLEQFKDKAQKNLDHLIDTLKTVRTGRATPSLIENLPIDAYGAKTPLIQLASITAPEPRVLAITVWDQSIAEAVEKAIKNSELNVNPSREANLLRINLPPMTEERRKELVKVVRKYAEDAKVALRNTRHEFLDALRKREKDQNLPESIVKGEENKVDEEIKKFNQKIDEMTGEKEKELMEI